ncbi:MAG: phosphopantetheine-binding protein [Tannerella sp.]|jgi:acyl carrier protein|nr:phosphopantetheine-binding protein [Tannerella sp.]
MDLENFLNSFASQFEDTELSAFTPQTKFKELEEWSSLMALAIIATVDEEYEVKIKGDDIRNSVTIEDLYNKIKSKM